MIPVTIKRRQVALERTRPTFLAQASSALHRLYMCCERLLRSPDTPPKLKKLIIPILAKQRTPFELPTLHYDLKRMAEQLVSLQEYLDELRSLLEELKELIRSLIELLELLALLASLELDSDLEHDPLSITRLAAVAQQRPKGTVRHTRRHSARHQPNRHHRTARMTTCRSIRPKSAAARPPQSFITITPRQPEHQARSY